MRPSTWFALIGLIVLGLIAALAFRISNRAHAPVSPNATTSAPTSQQGNGTYDNPRYGLAFDYPANAYDLQDQDTGASSTPNLWVILSEKGRTTPVNGEQGPLITVDAYRNDQRLAPREWVRAATNWTVANDAVPLTVAGQPAIAFGFDGLYAGKRVVVTRGDRAYVLGVTWVAETDPIVRDFDVLLASVRLTDPR